jgi:ethanolamine utilization microcompartment shell protein EutS
MTIRSAAPHATALVALAASAGLALAQAADGSEAARVLFPGDTLSDGSLITSVGAAQANNAGALGIEVRTPAAPDASSYAVLDGTRSGIVLTPGVTQIDGVTVAEFSPGQYAPALWRPWFGGTGEILGFAARDNAPIGAIAAGFDGPRFIERRGTNPPAPFPADASLGFTAVQPAADGPTLAWNTSFTSPTDNGRAYSVERNGGRSTTILPRTISDTHRQLSTALVVACAHDGPAILTGTVRDASGSFDALLIDDGSDLRTIATNNDPAPGFGADATLTITPSTGATIAPDHSIIWSASVTLPSGQTDIGFYRTRDGTTTLVASASNMLAAFGQLTGSAPAFHDYTFEHSLTPAGDLLLSMRPFVSNAPAPRSQRLSAAWLNEVTPDTLLIAPGQPAVGFPGQQVAVASIRPLAAGELGLLAYLGMLDEYPPFNATFDGLWTVAGPGGQHALWLHRGQSFEVAAGDRRTVDTIVPLHLTPDGLLTVRLGFDDATAGLFRLQLTAGPCNAADINADRSVDFGDVARFLRDYTEQAPAADINADAIIDAGDIAAFLAAFSAGC